MVKRYTLHDFFADESDAPHVDYVTFNDYTTLQADNERLREALKPFAQDDLCKQLTGNAQGDESPIFGRDKAMLYLGDFRRAKQALKGDE